MDIHIWWHLFILVAQIPSKCKLLMDWLMKVLHLSTSVILSWEGEGTKPQPFRDPFTVATPSCQWTATDAELSPSTKNWKALATATTSQRIVLWLRSWFFSSWHNKISFTHAATWASPPWATESTQKLGKYVNGYVCNLLCTAAATLTSTLLVAYLKLVEPRITVPFSAAAHSLSTLKLISRSPSYCLFIPTSVLAI